MAFQISKLAARVSVTRVLEKQKLARGVKFSLFHSPAADSPPCACRGINTAARSERFSTSSASVSKLGVFGRKRSVAVLFGTVGVSAAVLSSSAVCAMAARPPLSLDSDKSDWKEAKSEFLCCG